MRSPFVLVCALQVLVSAIAITAVVAHSGWWFLAWIVPASAYVWLWWWSDRHER